FLSRRDVALIACLFWAYVTLTEIVYYQAMSIELREMTQIMVTLPWFVRLMQHALMLPLLLLCYFLALRLGWKPAARRVPLQLALALAFSALMYWMMHVSEIILHVLIGIPAERFGVYTPGDWAVWLSSTVIGLLAYAFGLALLIGVATYRRYHDL